MGNEGDLVLYPPCAGNGSNSNSGTSFAQGWATVAHAAATLQKGQTACVAPTAASMTNCLAPVVAVVLGVVFVDERLSWNLVVGTAVVLLGVWIAEHNPEERGAAASDTLGAVRGRRNSSTGTHPIATQEGPRPRPPRH